MTPMDVFFFEAFDEEREAIARHLAPGIRAGYDARTIQAAGMDRAPAPLISIRTQSAVPASWLASLRGILSRTTGSDHLEALRTVNGLSLACLPEYCTRAVAEQAALLWMALLRKLPRQQAQWNSFDRDGLTGAECAGRCIVIVGVGRIGHEIAVIARGLGLRVLGVDPVQRHADIDYASWEDAAPQADIVVATMSLNAGNRNFFDLTRLAQVRTGAVFVNVARGELADVSGLAAALESGRLAAIGLDVFHDEPRLADGLRGLAPETVDGLRLRDLARDPRVILTPHNAFNTAESVERKSLFSAQQAESFLRTGRFRWPLQPADARTIPGFRA